MKTAPIWTRPVRATVALTLLCLAFGVLVAVPAHAAGNVGPNTAVGPEAAQFPEWYEDANGTRLVLCVDDPSCGSLSDDLISPDGEASWWSARSELTTSAGTGTIELAARAAFMGTGVDQEKTSGLLSVRIDVAEIGTYTITHPYGQQIYEVTAVGDGFEIDDTQTVGCIASPCDHALALDSPVFDGFLRWDPAFEPQAEPGYLGDGATPHTVIGSPTTNDFFRIDGPGVGGPGVDSVQNGEFVVEGKLATSPVAGDPPAAPDLAAADDSGASDSDDITKETTPTFTGVATPGAIVRLYSGDTLIGTGLAGLTGEYSIVSDALLDAIHSVTATEELPLGAESALSAALVATIDTSAETPVVDATSPASPANDDIPKVLGVAEPGSTVSTYVDAACTAPAAGTGTAAEFSSPGISTPVPSDATSQIHASVTDVAGNISACSTTFASYTEDSAAPDAPVITSAPASPSNDNDPSFEFTLPADAATAECSLETGVEAFSACTSPASYADLPDGTYTFTVRAIDAAGNVSTTASTLLEIDSAAPDAPVITSAPASPSNDNDPSFEFTLPADAATAECSLETGVEAFSACTSPASYADLPDGTYTFTVRAIDAAGNVSTTASTLLEIDSAAPDAPVITSAPASPSNDNDPSFEFTLPADAATAECSLETGVEAFSACTSPASYADLPDGTYTFTVRAIDAAGNVSATASTLLEIDTVGPNTVISSGAEALSTDTTPSFTFDFDGEAGVGLECSLTLEGGATFAPCTSPLTYAPQVDGDLQFQVRAIDLAGNAGTPSTWNFTIDTTAPISSLDSKPAAVSHDSTPEFGFTSNEPGSSYRCSLVFEGASASFSPCTSPKVYRQKADATYRFTLEATDPVGNVSTRFHVFTLVTPTLSVSIDAKPSNPTGVSDPTFAFSANRAATYECSLSTGTATFTACTSPKHYAARPDGLYTFKVRATDARGNIATTNYQFRIDTVGPVITVTNQPSNPTNDTTPTFEWTSPDQPAGPFECSVSSGAVSFAPCTSPATFGPLADGTYNFRVRTTDSAGNLTAVNRTFQVDTTGPTISVTAPQVSLVEDSTVGTDGSSTSVRASWSGTGVSSYTLQRSSGGGAFAGVSLSAPSATSNVEALANGSYVYRVRGSDGVNTTPYETGDAFTVSTVQQRASSVGYVGSWTTVADSTASGGSMRFAAASTADATFTFTGSSVGWISSRGTNRGQAQVVLDGAVVGTVDLFASTTQSRRLVTVLDAAGPGTHTLEIRVLGTKRAASTGTRIYIDGFVVLG